MLSAYSIANGSIVCSDGTSTDSNWLDFLLKEKNGIKVFDNLDYCVAKYLKHTGLHEELLKKLYKTRKLHFQGISYQYVPHKWFSLKYGGFGYAGFSDIGQYDQDLFNFKTPVEPLSRAERASNVGQVVFDTLTSLNLSPATLTSPVSVFDKQIMSKCNWPTCDDITGEACLYAYKCCHGGWLEAYKKGHFEETWDYDIAAAYGHFTSQLLDTRYGTWINTKDYQSKAEYGYCKGIVNITSEFSPILLSNSLDESYTPTGEWETYLTKREIDFIRDYKLGTFEIENGWWWIPEKRVKPLETMVKSLYEKREKRTGLEREVIKRIITGIFGKFGEIYDNHTLGPHFNPVWFCEIESQNRLSVARLVLGNNIFPYLLSIAVDGVLSSHPIPNISSKGSMGEWKLSANCPAIVISSGVVAVKDKKPTGPFSLQYDWLADQIKENPNAAEYTMTKLAPVTLGKAIQFNRMGDLGKLEEITKTVDITWEMKRAYKNEPENGGELIRNKYDSSPWDASVVERLRSEE